jgi:hypothetical protein
MGKAAELRAWLDTWRRNCAAWVDISADCIMGSAIAALAAAERERDDARAQAGRLAERVEFLTNYDAEQRAQQASIEAAKAQKRVAELEAEVSRLRHQLLLMSILRMNLCVALDVSVPPLTRENINRLTELVAESREEIARLRDDALAARVAADCHDKAHDERWCPTCEARGAGIEAYRAALRGEEDERSEA